MEKAGGGGGGEPGGAVRMPDRRAAIADAVAAARDEDCVLLLGKGHEQSQIIGDQRLPFDDRAAARACLRHRGILPSEP